MYRPPAFREDDLEVQYALVRAHPLGLLITAGAAGTLADPVPFVLDEKSGEHGTLRAHLSKANPQHRALAEADECLVVFQGPEAYITPSWYETKRETGKVVPTWNYVMVQIWGKPRVVEDAAWLRAQVDALTDLLEGRRPKPWAVADAPAPFVEAQLNGIFGVEIPIARIEGKWKASQNRSLADRAGVVAGLRADNNEPMADIVENRVVPQADARSASRRIRSEGSPFEYLNHLD